MLYPSELRQRVIDKHAQGDAQAEIAETLEVNMGWVNKIIRCFAAHGLLFPPQKKTGPKPKLGKHHRALIQEWLSKQPELTLAQRAKNGGPHPRSRKPDQHPRRAQGHGVYAQKKRPFPTSSAGLT